VNIPDSSRTISSSEDRVPAAFPARNPIGSKIEKILGFGEYAYIRRLLNSTAIQPLLLKFFLCNRNFRKLVGNTPLYIWLLPRPFRRYRVLNMTTFVVVEFQKKFNLSLNLHFFCSKPKLFWNFSNNFPGKFPVPWTYYKHMLPLSSCFLQ